MNSQNRVIAAAQNAAKFSKSSNNIGFFSISSLLHEVGWLVGCLVGWLVG